METHVMIPSGHTLVVGGLIQDDVRTGSTKVPLLGDIPLLGYLFRSDSESGQKSEHAYLSYPDHRPRGGFPTDKD